MYFIDTHSHLYLKQFNEDREQVVHNAINAGIQNILLPNIDSSTTSSMNTLCEHRIFPEKPARSVGVASIQPGRMRKKVVTDRPTDKNTPPHLWALNSINGSFYMLFS